MRIIGLTVCTEWHLTQRPLILGLLALLNLNSVPSLSLPISAQSSHHWLNIPLVCDSFCELNELWTTATHILDGILFVDASSCQNIFWYCILNPYLSPEKKNPVVLQIIRLTLTFNPISAWQRLHLVFPNHSWWSWEPGSSALAN